MLPTGSVPIENNDVDRYNFFYCGWKLKYKEHDVVREGSTVDGMIPGYLKGSLDGHVLHKLEIRGKSGNRTRLSFLLPTVATILNY